MKYRCEYKYSKPYNWPNHSWTVIGKHLAINLHIQDIPDRPSISDRYSGGIEFHWRSPPDYMNEYAPSHEKCWLIGGPCWHDGSSMQVTDYWIPEWLKCPNDHDRMFELLQNRMEEVVTGEPTNVVQEVVEAVNNLNK